MIEKVTDFKENNQTIKEIEDHSKFCKNLFKLSKENNSKLFIDLIKHFNYDFKLEQNAGKVQ